MSENSKRKAARALLSRSGYKSGGHVKAKLADGGSADDAGEAAPPIKLRDGGMAHGGATKSRADKKSRGHKGKGHTTVNVMVGHQQPTPVPVPVPKPVPVPINAGGPPGMPPGMPPGGPPGGPGPMPPDQGPPPPGLKRGGRAPKMDNQRDLKKGMPAGQFKKGGRTKGYPIDDGAGGGKARLEKAKAYGA